MVEPVSNIQPLQTRDDISRVSKLAEYIRSARDDYPALGSAWTNARWVGVGYFVKQAFAPRGSIKAVVEDDRLLDPVFIDFAKAYVKDEHLNNPAESRTAHTKRLQTLRMLEASLLKRHGTADVLKIDVAVLDAAAAAGAAQLKGGGPYQIGAELKKLASSMASRGVLPAIFDTWKNPNPQPKNTTINVDDKSEQARQDRLPDSDALIAIAEIFNRDLDPEDERSHKDIVTTGVIALLTCAPSRGQEIFRLPTNLVFKATDKFGDEQTGLRLHASKGFGAYVKWVWSEMVPVAEKAIERLLAVGEEARKLALHFENPKTGSRFYRHAECPAVGDDVVLTNEQLCAALGLKSENPNSALARHGLAVAQGPQTLQTVWDEYVLPRHRKLHPHFPYVSARDKAMGKKGGVKFSDSLFCLRKHQLHQSAATSPVFLWVPDLSDLNFELRGAKTHVSIFERYGYTVDGGTALVLKSHQIRHLLNTEGQRTGLSDVQIAAWSGRKNAAQNAVYNHQPMSERVEQARPSVELVRETLGSASETPKEFTHGQWRVMIMPKPHALSEGDDMQPHLSGLKTLYGECHHDYAFSPCQNFVKCCLDCNEHVCIKGSVEDAETKLGRLEALLRSVLVEVEKAKLASQESSDGEEWLSVQSRYATKIQQLIAILKSDVVPDGAIVRTAQGPNPTHLRRALRGLATRALASGTESKKVMEQMLGEIEASRGSASAIAISPARAGASHV